jgi:diaminohydroxyphosphoribosylaminopyrimidine deaminase/5-amino-6-(5-phosphoribosylamino)uracil reductase
VSPEKLSLTPPETSAAIESGNLVTSTLLPSYITLGSSMFTSCAPGATAYVTLEPCSHFGRTPPCCEALREAGVDRVVVGQRDPNPKVDGGGLLSRAAGGGVEVLVMDDQGSREVADDFLKRMEVRDERTRESSPPSSPLHTHRNHLNHPPIPPTPQLRNSATPQTIKDRRAKGKNLEVLTGSKKRSLRATANRLKSLGTMPEVHTPGTLTPQFLASLDKMLLDNPLVLMRNCGNKKKEAKEIGERVKGLLEGVEVAQVVGHTVLLYRLGVEGEDGEGEVGEGV